jgi:hypothetical protein
MGAKIAVHGLPDRVVIRESKPDAVDGRCRNQGRQDQARQREKLDPAGADLAQHVGVGTELVVGENLQVEAATGFGLDRRRHLLCPLVHRMPVREIVGVFVGEFGRLRPGHQRRADAAQNSRSSRYLQ